MKYFGPIFLLLHLKASKSDSQETIRQGRFFFGDFDFLFHHTSNGQNVPNPLPSPYNFVGSQRLNTFSDTFGDFYYDLRGNQVYLSCIDKYRTPREGCQGKPIYFPSSISPSSVDMYEPSYEDYDISESDDVDYVEVSAQEARRYRPYYGRFDGRGNINVGRGIYRAKGRDVEINCNFPRTQDVKRIVWCRVPSNSRRAWGDELQRERFRVERLGSSSTKLIIRNFQKERDSGTYRCFGMRNRNQRLEPIFMETVVKPYIISNYYSSPNRN